MASSRKSKHDNDDDNEAIMDFLRREATVGCMESQCKDYLNGRRFRNIIHLDSRENLDELSIYQPVKALTIQDIIDENPHIDIRLNGPPPAFLPLTILKISDDDSYIIPSEDLSINTIISMHRPPIYLLEAIVCKINERQVIFMKNLPNDDWYYYQEHHPCEAFNQDLNANLNRILRSVSMAEQKRLIQSAHILVSMIFYNAVKYIYKQQDR